MKYVVIVEENPGKMGGKPVVADTRIPLELLSDMGLKTFKRNYPAKKGEWWTNSLYEIKESHE